MHFTRSWHLAHLFWACAYVVMANEMSHSIREKKHVFVRITHLAFFYKNLYLREKTNLPQRGCTTEAGKAVYNRDGEGEGSFLVEGGYLPNPHKGFSVWGNQFTHSSQSLISFTLTCINAESRHRSTIFSSKKSRGKKFCEF